MNIHSSSIVEDGAVLGEGVEIGPFCHVSSEVKLGNNVSLQSHVVVTGNSDIGDNARIFPFASIGQEPQDLKFNGEKTSLKIGVNCIIREGVTINTGTEGGGSVTEIGDRCVFLANSHVAHDCILGNNIILSNNVMLAGHCQLADYVICGGGSAIHQFSRIGRNSFIGGMTGIEGDVIPFGMMRGAHGRLVGLNVIGMKRNGFDRSSIKSANSAFKLIFAGEFPIRDVASEIRETAEDPLVIEILDFISKAKDRQLCRPLPPQG
jgi:UDP-N-acetylglucosamine acyltransferase